MKRNMKGINTFTLKWIAILSMLIDHVGAILFPGHLWLRIVGRVSFPIFAYLLVEGFVYTSNVKKYMLRLGAFALISEVAYDLAFFGVPLEFTHQNVFFTLFVGVLMLQILVQMPEKWKQMVVVAVLFVVAYFLRIDYGYAGLLMILLFYALREQRLFKLVAVAAVNVFIMGGVQVYAAFAMIPIAFHNRTKGPGIKWLFYVFYPAHLILLYLALRV